MHLHVIPGWVWGIAVLLLLGELDQLIRPRLEWPRFRCHLLGGVAVLMLILVLVPLADMLVHTSMILWFWLPALVAGIIVGFCVANWVHPILYNSERGLFYQEPDWWGVILIIVALGLQWLAYQLMADNFSWQHGGLIMAAALTANAFLGGFFTGRNGWYVHLYHNVRVIV